MGLYLKICIFVNLFYKTIIMYKKQFISVLVLTLMLSGLFGQSQKSALVVFYNVENLFDVEIDPFVDDYDFSPSGQNRWNLDRYNQKLAQISHVISEIGSLENQPPTLVSLCEVETEKVLADLCSTQALKAYGFDIIHFNTVGGKGLDVALLYRADEFKVLKTVSFAAHHEDTLISRKNILKVTGLLHQIDTLHLIVYHGTDDAEGEKHGKIARQTELQLIKAICDSLQQTSTEAQILVMGDFNHNPISEYGYKKVSSKKDTVPESNSLYNPMFKMFRQGLGTYINKDLNYMYDQFNVS